MIMAMDYSWYWWRWWWDDNRKPLLFTRCLRWYVRNEWSWWVGVSMPMMKWGWLRWCDETSVCGMLVMGLCCWSSDGNDADGLVGGSSLYSPCGRGLCAMFSTRCCGPTQTHEGFGSDVMPDKLCVPGVSLSHRIKRWEGRRSRTEGDTRPGGTCVSALEAG